MEAVVRGLFIYFFLVVLFMVSGKRSLAQLDTFDFVLLLVISEAAQNALVGHNYSMTYAVALITTLAGCQIAMAWIRQRAPKIDRYFSGGPIILVDHGKPLEELMKKSRIDHADILAAAREKQGLERMEQIKYAVLETGGEISIIPAKEPAGEKRAA